MNRAAKIKFIGDKLDELYPNPPIPLDFTSPFTLLVAVVAEIIKPCGFFNTKSVNIFKLSQALVEKFKGEVPHTFEELESLPGVGHKTASVIMSHIFKLPAFPVDTHIHRLAERWGLSDGSSVEKTEEDLKKAFPESEWEKRHLQIIYFGRNYCKARGHKDEECPICSVVRTRG